MGYPHETRAGQACTHQAAVDVYRHTGRLGSERRLLGGGLEASFVEG